jgi:hypothetical protein
MASVGTKNGLAGAHELRCKTAYVESVLAIYQVVHAPCPNILKLPDHLYVGTNRGVFQLLCSREEWGSDPMRQKRLVFG